MQELLWLNHLPERRLEGGIEIANQLYWNITIFRSSKDGLWYVKSGEKIILKTDNHDAIDTFIYGLGLAYSVLPESVFEQLKKEVKKWVE